MITQKKLYALAKTWRKKHAEYDKQTRNKLLTDSERQRYEGIATGTRWCLEDLERLEITGRVK